jgi:hypothetical protein
MQHGVQQNNIGNNEKQNLNPPPLSVKFQSSTRFAGMKSWSARIIIIAFLGIIVYGVLFCQSMIPSFDTNKRGEDLRCYRRIVERIQSGESYYQATYSELRSRGYPTNSVFNWRMPLLAWTMGQSSNIKLCQLIGIILSLVTLAIWISVLQVFDSFNKMLAGSLLLLGLPIYSFIPDVFLVHEFWAGALITLSLAAYAKGWRLASSLFGLMALFVREIALPYIIIMLVLSYYEKHRREALIWLSGIFAFTLMMVIHISYIKNITMNNNLIQFGSWITLGGWQFVLSTAQMHPYLLLLPIWFTAMVLPMAILGLIGWKDPLFLRISATICLYISIFLFIGKPFNMYWGMIYVNILLLGLLNTFYSMRDLWQSARIPYW